MICGECGGRIRIERERIPGVGIADYWICGQCGLIAPDSNTVKYVPDQLNLF